MASFSQLMNLLRGRQLKAAVVLGSVSLLILQGCSTSGVHSQAQIKPAPNTVVFERPVPTELRAYENLFVDVFNKRGMVRGESTDPNALRLKLEFDPNVFAMKVISTLRQDNTVVAVGRAVNPGFGTLLARDAAIAGLAANSAAQLDANLESLGDRLVILGKKTPGESQISLSEELAKIEELHKRGVLSDAEFELAKKKILAR